MTLSSYIKTYLALVALATLSLLLKGLPDTLALSLSLVIAGIKAVVVLLFFMHLIEERFSFRFVMLVASLLVGVLVVLTALDPMTRAPYAPGPSHNPSYAHRNP
ncbi:MAG TPA: cytochrome C oxidase subunit IV family protein [Polyangiales bacterium]|jgi:cytochrome c oxidase subunit 4|nr:cytochrome C oxidase subunit IV family protein [Polyangiales bacterium]